MSKEHLEFINAFFAGLDTWLTYFDKEYEANEILNTEAGFLDAIITNICLLERIKQRSDLYKADVTKLDYYFDEMYKRFDILSQVHPVAKANRKLYNKEDWKIINTKM